MTSSSSPLLVCLDCASELVYGVKEVCCLRCGRHWPYLNNIPIVVEEPDIYIRTTLARAEVARVKVLDRLLRSLEHRNSIGRAHGNQPGSLLDVLHAHNHNFAFLERILRPLRENFLIEDEIKVNDLDPYIAGYGPIAAIDYLLQDWRIDTDEGLKLADLQLPPARCRRAVVLGSGAGRALAALAGSADAVIGVDLSYVLAASSRLLCRGERAALHEVRLSHVRQASDRITVHELGGDGKMNPEVQVLVADATRTPLPSGCADWVTASLLFDLLPDGRALIQEARRLLLPGGFVVLMTMFGYDQEDLWAYYTPDQIVGMLEEYGFSVVSTSWHNHSYLNSPKSNLSRYSEMLRILARAL